MAVPSKRATYQLKPKPKCATAATAAVVRNVPTTPTTTIGAAAPRNRRQPMCMPPSNKMHNNATVTMRSTMRSGGAPRPRPGRATATADAARNNAGAGTRNRAVSRLESTAATAASEITSKSWANGPVSVMNILGRGHHSSHCRPDFPAHRFAVYGASVGGDDSSNTKPQMLPWQRREPLTDGLDQACRQRSTGRLSSSNFCKSFDDQANPCLGELSAN